MTGHCRRGNKGGAGQKMPRARRDTLFFHRPVAGSDRGLASDLHKGDCRAAHARNVAVRTR